MTTLQQEVFVRDVGGVGASIILLLMTMGRPLTALELEEKLDTSDKPIRKALKRLREWGAVVHHSNTDGWGLAGGQLPLFQNAPGFAPTTESPSAQALPEPEPELQLEPEPEIIETVDEEESGNSRSSMIGCLIDLTTDEDGSTNQPDHRARTAGKSRLTLARALTDSGIRGKVALEFQRQRVDAANLMAWYWWCSTQNWINRSKAGYVIKRIQDGESAPAAFVAAVNWWWLLDEDDHEWVICHMKGSDNGLFLHTPPANGVELFRTLASEDDGVQVGTAVLDALLDVWKSGVLDQEED